MAAAVCEQSRPSTHHFDTTPLLSFVKHTFHLHDHGACYLVKPLVIFGAHCKVRHIL